jgi:hypothetical protein
MASPEEITAAVRTVLEQRLRTMGLPESPISADEAAERFGYRTRDGGLQYQIELAGHPCLYGVWLAAPADAAALQGRLDGEIATLQGAGRALAASSTTIDSLVVLYTQVLASRSGNGAGPPQSTLERFIESVWDHDTMRAVYLALSPPKEPAHEPAKDQGPA